MKLPKHWQYASLEDVSISPQYGWTTKSSQNGKVKYLRTTDISSGNIDWKSVPFCQEVPNPIETFELKKDDLLISRSGSVGLSFLVENLPNKKVVFASYLIRFQPIIINPKFLLYFTKSKQFFDAIVENSEGSAVQNVSAKRLCTIQIPIAPLKEQTQIVSILDDIFEKFETAKKQLAKIPRLLERYRQSVLERAVSGELTEDWREENNVEFNWENIILGKIIKKIEAGKSFLCEERIPKENEVGVLKVSAISWGEYLETECKTCVNPELVNPNLFVKRNDFLMSRANTKELVGATVIVKNVTKQIMLSDKTLRIAFDALTNSNFINYILRSNVIRKQIEYYATGSQESMKNISQEKIKNITIPYPSLPEQTEIVNRVEKLLKKADEAEAKYKAAMKMIDKLQASVLAMAFRGELSEPQPNDEPVSELLEKIKTEKARLEQERKEIQKSQSQIKRTMAKTKKEKKSILAILENSSVTELTVEECYRESGQPTPAAFFKDLRNNLALLDIQKKFDKPEGEVKIKLKAQ